MKNEKIATATVTNMETGEESYSRKLMDFVHLHLHTHYGLSGSIIQLEPLFKTVRSYGMSACAITDHGNMHGVPSFCFTAREMGIKPIIGIEACVDSRTLGKKTQKNNENNHIILLAHNDIGYSNLIKLASSARSISSGSTLSINKDVLKECSEGLICLTTCIHGEIPSLIIRGDDALLKRAIEEYSSIFHERLFFELQHNNMKEQKIVNERLISLSRHYGIPLVATNNCQYLNMDDVNVYESLQRNKKGKERLDMLRCRNEGLHVASPEEMYRVFSNYPEALSNTVRIAEMCNVAIGDIYYWPEYEVWSKLNAHEYLGRIAGEGLEKRMEAITGRYRERLHYELDIIGKCEFSQYFLVVADYVNYAKRMNIPVAPGQGYESGSLLAYCLGITDIDPIRHNLSFEMFIDPMRVTFPDIDVAFSAKGRKEVIGYLSDKYGKESVANVIQFHTKQIKGCASGGLIYSISVDNSAVLLYDALSGHVPPLYQKKNIPVTQYDRMGLLSVGFIPHDLHGLRQLDLMQTVLDLLKADGRSVDVSTIPLNDQRTYEFLGHGDISGVFSYKEHRMKGLLETIKPHRFEDLVSLVAINSSPSVNKSMVEEYAKNKNNPSLVRYETPLVEAILSGTYGIILYIEHIRKIVTVIARFSAPEFYKLRRTVMLQESTQQIKNLEEQFITKSVHNGVSEDIAKRIYCDILNNGGNICSKARTTSSALLAYRMAYLKANYYEYFMNAVRSKQ